MARTARVNTDTSANDKKAATLRKLALKRVPRAVKAIDLCGNLAAYSPTAEQRKAVLEKLLQAVAGVKNRFEIGKAPEDRFSFPA